MKKDSDRIQEPVVTTTRRSSGRCTYCGNQAPLVWVHGHGQCSGCGTNVEECCRGEQQYDQVHS